MFTKYTLYIGLNDKDSKVQEINTIDAYKIVGRLVGDCTIKEARGLYLHDNLIAIHNDKGQIFFTLAGWPTLTTRERLNAIQGLRITQKAGKQYANGVEINPVKWYMLTPCATVEEIPQP